MGNNRHYCHLNKTRGFMSNHHYKRNKNHGKPKQRPEAYNPPYDTEILAMSIEGLDLSPHTLTALKSAKILTVRDLVSRYASEMYKIQNFGKRNLQEVSARLSALGVDFKPTANLQKVDKGERKEVAVKDNSSKNPAKSEKGKNTQSFVGGKDKSLKQDNSAKVRKETVEDKKLPPVGSGKDAASLQVSSKSNSYDSKRLFPKGPFVPTPPLPEKKDRFVKFQRAGKWGFKDEKGKEVIPPIYDEVFSFKDDYACVEKNGLFGYITRKNELTIPYKYTCASSFAYGLACVSLDDKCGYIDVEDKVVIPFIYDAGTAFDADGTARAKRDGRWGILSRDGAFSFI